MSFNKGSFILIVLALLLQACGSTGKILTTPPPIVTQPTSGTELPLALTEAVATQDLSSEFFTAVPLRSGFGFRSAWMELYFTDPVNPLAAREVGGVDAFLSSAIVAARESVDLALRNLNLDSITSALVVANRRGIPVRVVAESCRA